jgi:hypothetical protein
MMFKVFLQIKISSRTRSSHFLFPQPPQIALNNRSKAATSFDLLCEGSLPPRNTWSLVLQAAVSSGLMGFTRAFYTVQSVFITIDSYHITKSAPHCQSTSQLEMAEQKQITCPF